MNLLILGVILLFEINFNHGHVVPKIHRYNGTEAFEIRENSGSPVRIVVPKADNLTLREIIYYHLIEKPYDGRESKGVDDDDDEVQDYDEARRPFTNGHGFQFLDSFEDEKKDIHESQLPASDESSSISEESEELQSLFRPEVSSSSEGSSEKASAEDKSSTVSVSAVTEKRNSRNDLFEQQKQRYEKQRTARVKRTVTQAEIPPPPTLPPLDAPSALPTHKDRSSALSPLDPSQTAAVPFDIRKRMAELLTAKSVQGNDSMKNLISSRLAKIFGLDTEPQITKDDDEDREPVGPSPRTYGVNMKNGEGYVWNGLWSNTPITYHVGENVPDEDSEISKPNDDNDSDEIFKDLTDLLTEIENLTDDDNNDTDTSPNDQSSNEDDTPLEEDNSSADVNSFDDASVEISPGDDNSSNDRNDDSVSDDDISNDSPKNNKSNVGYDDKENEKLKNVKNDELAEDDGSYKPIGDDGSYKPSGEDGSYRPIEYESDKNDEPTENKVEKQPSEGIDDFDVEVINHRESNDKLHSKHMSESAKKVKSPHRIKKNQGKHNIDSVKGKSVPNGDNSEKDSDKKHKHVKKQKEKKVDQKKGFFKGNFTLDKYDTSNNDDYDHLEEKYVVHNKAEAKRIDTLVEIMKDEQFWKWLAEWTSTYMEVLSQYIKKLAREEITSHMKEWESKHHEEIEPKREKADEKKHHDKKEENQHKVEENRQNEPKNKSVNEREPAESKEKHEEKPEKLQPTRDIDEEDAIIIDGKRYPLNHNSNIDEIDVITQFLKERRNKDKKTPSNPTTDQKTKDEDNKPTLHLNKTQEVDRNKTSNVQASVIYGNAVDSDSVTNIFVFYPNGEQKQTHHSIPRKDHIKPNKDESTKEKDTTKTPVQGKPSEEKITTKPEAPKETNASDDKTTEAPKNEIEKVSTTEIPVKNVIKDEANKSSGDHEKHEFTTEASTKAPETKPNESNKEDLIKNEERDDKPSPQNDKKSDKKVSDDSKKSSDSDKKESKEEKVDKVKGENKDGEPKIENEPAKTEKDSSTNAKPDDIKPSMGDKKNENESKKDETESKHDSDSKKDESDSKKAETDNKKDENDAKKDDTDSQKIETDSNKNESNSKKDEQKDVTDSKKNETDSKNHEPDSKKDEPQKTQKLDGDVTKDKDIKKDSSADEKKDARR